MVSWLSWSDVVRKVMSLPGQEAVKITGSCTRDWTWTHSYLVFVHAGWQGSQSWPCDAKRSLPLLCSICDCARTILWCCARFSRIRVACGLLMWVTIYQIPTHASDHYRLWGACLSLVAATLCSWSISDQVASGLLVGFVVHRRRNH